MAAYSIDINQESARIIREKIHIAFSFVIAWLNKGDRLKIEGLVRSAGNDAETKALALAFMTTGEMPDSVGDAHIFIGILKKIIHDHEACLRGIDGIDKLLEGESITHIIDLLIHSDQPEEFEKGRILYDLMHLCYIVAEHGKFNHMGDYALAVALGQTLLGSFSNIELAQQAHLISLSDSADPKVKLYFQALASNIQNEFFKHPFDHVFSIESEIHKLRVDICQLENKKHMEGLAAGELHGSIKEAIDCRLFNRRSMLVKVERNLDAKIGSIQLYEETLSEARARLEALSVEVMRARRALL